MKKILLSKITKLIIFLLSAFCVFSAVFILIYIDNTGYRLHETEYEKSYAFSSEIRTCLNIIDNAVYEKNYSQKASILRGADESKVKYYINQDGEELTNFKTSPEDYRNFTLYYLYDRAAETAENNAYSLDGEAYFADSEYFSYIYQTNGLDKLFIGFDINGFSEEKSFWQKEKNNVNGFICTLPVLAVLFLFCLVYLTVTAGRGGNTDEIKLNFMDKIPAEIIIGAAVIIFSLSLALFVLIWDILYYAGLSVNEVGYLSGMETAAAYALILPLWLSLVKSLKRGELLNRFLIFRILKGLLKTLKEFEGCCVSIAEYKLGSLAAYIPKLGVILGITLFFLGIAYEEWEIWLAEIPLIFLFLLLSRFSKFLSQTDIIKKGIDEIKNGNTDYKTEGVEIPYLKEMADNLNEIGNGLSISIENALKSERMKTELITNVSHDLKTPLTSIINFSELLCGEELTPPEANEYAKIIYDKSKRLKSLTSDLFDMAKLQSGSEEMNFEKIDLCLLIRQTLAEYEKAIAASGLEFITDFQNNEQFITADGKKLSRVICNLIDNCLKYSLENTRVYITVKKLPSGTVFEIKNISKDRLSCSPEELTERFVRGDASRSTEGSGLGLAIAKSYTLANKAAFDITADGDLFKIVITF